MEVAVGCVLFRRSQNLKLQYGNVVCDGDSKTIQALNTEVYGDTPIIKEDCINHVAKTEMPLMFGGKIGKQEINIPAINCPSLPTQTYLGLPHLNCH